LAGGEEMREERIELNWIATSLTLLAKDKEGK
jgi:hypothetical protein